MTIFHIFYVYDALILILFKEDLLGTGLRRLLNKGHVLSAIFQKKHTGP